MIYTLIEYIFKQPKMIILIDTIYKLYKQCGLNIFPFRVAHA